MIKSLNTSEMHIPSNKVKDIERYIMTKLDGLYSKGELRVFVVMLFEAILKWSHVKLMINHDKTINQSDLLKFHWAVEDLRKHRPIQYICGYTEFCNLHIEVTPDTLIPRPETEEMVHIAASLTTTYRMSGGGLRILDLCCGSGCIAIAMQYIHSGSIAHGVDISESALKVARKNAKINKQHTEFFQCDILQGNPPLPFKEYDVILSNPPYVRNSEKAQMEANVLDYEPALALFVKDSDPLVFYRAIGEYAQKHMSKEGFMLVEINEALGAETASLLQTQGFMTRVIHDFREKERYVLARWPKHQL